MNNKLINFDKQLKELVINYRSENHDQSKKKAELLFEQYPNNIDLFNTIGVLFLQNKKFKDAIIVFNKLLTLSPKDVNIYHNLGIAWTQLNNIDEAIKFYLKAEKFNSKVVQMLVWRATVDEEILQNLTTGFCKNSFYNFNFMVEQSFSE